MVYGELGENPLIISAHTRMIMFWANICQDSDKPKISNLMYKLLYKLNEENVYQSPWLNCVKRFWEIVVFLVFGEVKSSLVVRNVLNNKLNKHYSTSLDKNGQQLSYRMFKSYFKIEHYLTTLTYNNRRLLARFRCRNHNLPVEIECHRGISREQRKCNWCENELGDGVPFYYELFYF